MLGKGLNSLIPPQGGDEPRGNIFPAQGPSMPPPASLPPIDPAHELPPMPTEPELPAFASPQSRVDTRDAGGPPPAPAIKPSAGKPAAGASAVASAKAGRQSEAVFPIEVSKIKPNPQQPRRAFGEDGINELAASIREFGILQPIVVSKANVETPTGTDVEYTLLAGERRLLAAKKLGMETIPAIVRRVDLDRERLEIAIIENIQREDLNPVEIARAMARLQDEFRLTQREIASRLGKSRETVANTVRLLDLPPEVQRALERGEISESHGRLLLAIDDPGAQQKLFRDLVQHHMTTRELKERVEAVSGRRRGRPRKEPLPPEFAALKERLTTELGAPVEIEKTESGGTLTIKFYSDEELESIVERLGGEGEEEKDIL